MLDVYKNVAINDISMPEKYKKISNNIQKNNIENQKIEFNLPLYNLIKVKKNKLNTPDKNVLSVTDITDNIDKYKIFFSCILEDEHYDTINTEQIGTKTNIEYINATTLLGHHLPNIVISINKKGYFYKCLEKIVDRKFIRYMYEEKIQHLLIYLRII